MITKRKRIFMPSRLQSGFCALPIVAAAVVALGATASSLVDSQDSPNGCGGIGLLEENFDGVTPPPGWVVTNAIDPDGIFWVTSNSGDPSPHPVIADHCHSERIEELLAISLITLSTIV
jgi:hypothetical protein